MLKTKMCMDFVIIIFCIFFSSISNLEKISYGNVPLYSSEGL